jgi:hypothetical protein
MSGQYCRELPKQNYRRASMRTSIPEDAYFIARQSILRARSSARKIVVIEACLMEVN